MPAARPPAVPSDPLLPFHEPVRRWFTRNFSAPTSAQVAAWPLLASGQTALVLAPTGSGKTLAAFLSAIDRLMFDPVPDPDRRCRVLYLSPLKALAVDVERNLRAPLQGVAHAADELGHRFHLPEITVRTGDTPTRERAAFARRPGDILITTPESLYLLLTTAARATLRSVRCVIIDELHALLPGKRGAHLMLSLERLEALCGAPVQRIGLSATVQPVEEAARYLGGYSLQDGLLLPRPVAVADARRDKRLELRVEVPVEDMARPGKEPVGGNGVPSGPASQGEVRQSIWPAIHPLILDLIGQHRSTLIFVNSRRLAERLSGALNELAAERAGTEGAQQVVRAHHGSISRLQRMEIEDELKAGKLPALVATSSLELGIDMGAIDLVIQVEAPPSVSSGMQRIGRAGHTIDAPSRGVILPKYRGDLLACAALVGRMYEGAVERQRYPRNPLDVLAQQIVALVAAPPLLPKRPGRGRVTAPIGAAAASAAGAAAEAASTAGGAAAADGGVPAEAGAASDAPADPADPAWHADEVYALVRRAAPFAELTRPIFDGVLDLLSGLYPSDEFAELRPRLTWDRIAGTLRPRHGARSVAIISGGTIPDRGLYGVFLVGAGGGAGDGGTEGGPGGRPGGRSGAGPGGNGPDLAAGGRSRRGPSLRVGELDEEMVFESRPGDTFILGASTWRIEEITHDRVLVSPAPGVPGKMPFWRGDAAGRPLEFGRAIGALSRALLELPTPAAHDMLRSRHGLSPGAADNLLRYLGEQAAATGTVPDDRTIVIEHHRDELGDARLCIMSPLGAQVHGPWALAISALLREHGDTEPDILWTDDGIIARFPGGGEARPLADLIPDPDEVEALVARQLSGSALFAARFREAAVRALLLPRRFPGQRTALWQQRKRGADLLRAASRFPSFPIVLEAYRECLRDIFDIPAFVELLKDIRRRRVRLVEVHRTAPSPFAAALLFNYTANFLYDGDAPLAERRAQALLVDPLRLRELLGDVELRELLDEDTLLALEAQLQHLTDDRKARREDAVHDLLLRVGDLSPAELAARCDPAEAAAGWADRLVAARRAVPLRVAGEARLVAVEDVARYRDALGIPPPPGLPAGLLVPVKDALQGLVSRYARTHGPFLPEVPARRFGLGVGPVLDALHKLETQGRLLQGAFRPGGSGVEHCDAEVLRLLRQRSLARLRREVEPVDGAALGRLYLSWQGIGARRGGAEALLEVIEQIQGVPLPASVLEEQILPARLGRYDPYDLDRLLASGSVLWVGHEPLGEHDGKVALYLSEHAPLLVPPPQPPATDRPLHERLRQLLRARGALFFPQLQAACGGFSKDLLDALWDLVWAGEVTNDTLQPLRAYVAPARDRGRRQGSSLFGRGLRLSRSEVPREASGRWTLLSCALGLPLAEGGGALDGGEPTPAPDVTERLTALAQQLLLRHGVLTREAAQAEGIVGGFTAIYPVLKGMEESGQVRRGYFVSGRGATQFALPGAVEQLRLLREVPQEPRHDGGAAVGTPRVAVLAATDPANPYGAALPWPERAADADGRRPGRAAGALVVLVDGALAAWLARGEESLVSFLSQVPERTPAQAAQAVAQALAGLVGGRRRAVMIAEVDGRPPSETELGPALQEAGFAAGSHGYLRRA